ncbi:MAG TPA: STAS domain-containing protein [Tepidisphaeraceae bacterium]|jgi:anti-anti-sigma factor|nr:STAS domain-containing protein [Tepidisphaeraceae bacterium]
MSSEPEDLVVRQHEDITVVRIKLENLSGIMEIDRISRDLVRMVDDGGVTKLILDLKYTRFFSSSALGMLILLAQKLNAKGGKLVISHPEHILPLLKVTRMGNLFQIADDPKAASKLF